MFSEFCYYLLEIHGGKEGNKSKFISSLIGISFLQGLNFVALLGVLNYIYEPNIPRYAAVYVGLFLWIIITVINYFFLYRNKTAIINRVERFSPKREVIGKTIFVTYIFATFVFVFYVMNNFAGIKNPTYNTGVIIGYSQGYHSKKEVDYMFNVNGIIYRESHPFNPREQIIEIGDTCFVVYSKNNPYNSHLVEIMVGGKSFVKLQKVNNEPCIPLVRIDTAIYKSEKMHFHNYQDSSIKK